MNNKITTLLSVFIILTSLLCEAQEKSRSELRKEQKHKQKVDAAYESDSPEFSEIKVPVRYKNHSIVVLAKQIEYSFLYDYASILDESKIIYKEKVRMRIKLQDNAAITAFSEFYFYGDDSKKYIRIIKPDGEKIDLDLSKAIKVTSGVPDHFKSYSLNAGITYKKMAIPNLEVNDILDYSFSTKKTFTDPEVAFVAFPKLIIPIQTSNAILYQKTIFESDKVCLLTTRSVNGAPELQRIPGQDGSTKVGKMYFEVRNQEPTKKEEFDYPLMHIPYIKFQVVYNRGSNRKKLTHYFRPNEQGEIRRTVGIIDIQTEVQRILDKAESSLWIKSYAKGIIKDMAKYNPTVTEKTEYLQKCYYMARTKLHYSNWHSSMSDEQFVRFWQLICEHNNWGIEIGIAYPKAIGKIENITSLYEIDLFVIVDEMTIFNSSSKNKPFKYSPNWVEGTSAYIYSQNESASSKIKRFHINSSSFSENSFREEQKITLDFKTKKAVIIDTIFSTGHCKSYYRKAVFYEEDLYQHHHLLTGIPKKKEKQKRKNRGNKFKLQEIARVNKEKEDKIFRKKTELIKTSLHEDGCTIDSITSFSLIKDGRSELFPERVYSIDFEVNDLIQKVGNNYLFSLGKLIGNYFEVEKRHSVRQNDVYFSYEKTHQLSYRIAIPEGYKPAGVNNLLKRIDNSAMLLEITATTTDKEVIVNYSVSYKASTVKREKWNEVLDVLTSVQDFYESKIMFKKI
ncbi:MAG: hypothetical protein ACJA0Q_000961 [Saprospiraceae bacterium]|jgi:hypothetical protein